MKSFISFLSLLLLSETVHADLYVTIIQGLEGTPGYHEQFSGQTEILKSAADTVAGKDKVRVFTAAEATRENILAHFEHLSGAISEQDRAAVFMIGHGSYDGFEYKFNIPGPDITGEDITTMMDSLPAGIQLLVNTSSASGAINSDLERDSRVVISATRNGNERLATRFGGYFFEAFKDPAADVNKNNSVTAREAFDYAERHVKDYFETQGQLATEHPFISGAHAGQFVLARTDPVRPGTDDPELVRLIRERGEIDVRIEELQLKKAELEPGEYMSQLQQLMIDMSMVQEEIDKLTGKRGD